MTNHYRAPEPNVFGDDYDDAYNRSFEESVSRRMDYHTRMSIALGDAELTFTGAADENLFYSDWQLAENTLKAVEGLDMVHLTIHAVRPSTNVYGWQGARNWTITITHMGGCFTKDFRS